MKIHKILIAIALVVLCTACGDESLKDSDLFSIEIKNPQKKFAAGDHIEVSINSLKKKKVEQVVFSLGNSTQSGSENFSASLDLSEVKLGNQRIKAEVTSEGRVYTVYKIVTIYASDKPVLYTYKILETYPHDINAYTQGLEFKNDTLYESTGQYGESTLRKLDYETGEVLQSVPLPKQYFGEGLTILNNKVYQLTWQEDTGFIYKLPTLEKSGTFVYGKSVEGWGLCNDGTTIYKSDGTERIWSLNSNTLAEDGYIELYTNTSKIPKVNELEWVEGRIFANIYQKSAVAIVNPASGAVEGVIDLTTLKNNVTQHEKLDVLNGIAYKGEPNIIYVTGKNWDKLFKIEIVEK
ncbi:glutaminyl-peptide cyclotransferase [Constantimarinum furrinae]|uniref:Glutamine cyclotransferase n=1 Tax=Constantimarinum furrinae TaxID=2562285 RepID=A0A7G8PXX6_9FLAO|nr:glutaminyl-peptide cyclotransferase [Constantimarinum furrinae]QNJ99192.1 Glutamine cyclotransferase [Constantimarinum furrinae]